MSPCIKGKSKGTPKSNSLGVPVTQPSTTLHFLSVQEAAEYLGISRQAFTRRNLPAPDATIGKHQGWTQQTLDKWNEDYPKPGRRWSEDESKNA